MQIPVGTIFYKKLRHGQILTLVSTGRGVKVDWHNPDGKCRFESAQVLEIEWRGRKHLPLESFHDRGYTYPKEGEVVEPESYNDSEGFVCAPGIHGFLSRDQALGYWY